MVTSPTHRSGHILDIIIIECNLPLLSSIHIGNQFSEHKFIHAALTITKSVPPETIIKYQQIKNINIDEFGSNVRNHYTDLDQESPCGQLLTDYNETLLETFKNMSHCLRKSAKLHIDNHGS